jgi:catechol 2,3-dioxygenase-like lactoylglutathione lyase family enzyme
MTISRISRVTIIVQDLNEALRWYTKTLGLEKRVDDDKTIPGFRWLTGSPKDQSDLEIVLLQARGKDELARVGHNAVWVLQTGDCRKTYEELTKRGVKFTSPPEEALGASPRFLNTCTATHLTWSSRKSLNRLPLMEPRMCLRFVRARTSLAAPPWHQCPGDLPKTAPTSVIKSYLLESAFQ